jgi:hypothetical protein
MTGEGEVSNWWPEHEVRCVVDRGAGQAHTSDDPGLQRGLVARLRGALLFADLLEVVVNQRPRALGDGRSHLLQARGHGGEQVRRGRLPEGEVVVSGGSETLPDDVGAREHWGLRRNRLGSGAATRVRARGRREGEYLRREVPASCRPAIVRGFQLGRAHGVAQTARETAMPGKHAEAGVSLRAGSVVEVPSSARRLSRRGSSRELVVQSQRH